MMKRQLPINTLLCACLALTFFTNSSVADIFAPPGLSPGDTFHWVFVTSTTRNATSSNIDDYNQFVQAAANASPESVFDVQGVSTLADIQWRAIASTATVDARDNIGDPASGIHLLDGLIVATDEAQLWGTHTNPINLTELNTPATDHHSSAPVVWTGTTSIGTAVSGRALGDGSTYAGNFNLTDAGWIYFGYTHCNIEFPLYAISSELTVVPLPGAVILGLSGLMSSSLVMYRRRKQCRAGDTTH